MQYIWGRGIIGFKQNKNILFNIPLPRNHFRKLFNQFQLTINFRQSIDILFILLPFYSSVDVNYNVYAIKRHGHSIITK